MSDRSPPSMTTERVAARLRQVAERPDYSGVFRLERGGTVVDEFAGGLAHRAHAVPNEIGTRFATASAAKTFTALAVMTLVEAGEIALDQPVRELLGDRLPLIDNAVTVEHLLAHRSGIGDYLDEEALGDIDDHVLAVSAHTLERPNDYLPLLDGRPQREPPGATFRYNNSGYVVLSLLIELVTGDFHETVVERVLRPAGVGDGGYFRSDDLPARAATGYLKNGRSNVFHLPVIGGGDGGVYLSLDDVSSFWAALLSGRIVSEAAVDTMTSVVSRHDRPSHYGLGFWLRTAGRRVELEGMDAGVSFRSTFDRETGECFTAMSNTSSGVWPLVEVLDAG